MTIRVICYNKLRQTRDKPTMALIKNKLITNISLILAAILVLIGLYLSFSQVREVHAESAETTTAGLVGWWKFNEGSGTISNSTSPSTISAGSLNDMEAADWSADVPTCGTNSNSLNFDNASGPSYERATYGYQSNLHTDSVSISLWMKTDDITRTGGLVNYLDNSGDYGGYTLVQDTDYLLFGVSTGVLQTDGITIDTSSYTPLQAGVWYHVVATYDSATADAAIYIDGQEAAVVYGGDSSPPVIHYDFDHDLTFGLLVNSGTKAYDGKLDDIRIFNRVVTADDRTQLKRLNCEDGDNIPIEEEDNAPNNGDGNDDGIPDAEQANVTSMINNVVGDGAYQTMETQDASCDEITSIAINNEPEPPLDDAAYDYPAGLTSFTIDCDGTGETTTIKIIYDQVYNPVTFIVRKVIDDVYTDIPGAVYNQELIDGVWKTTVEYDVTDGGALDADGLEDGVITDPVGVAEVNAAAAPDTGFGPGPINRNTETIIVIMFGLCAVGFLTRKIYAEEIN